MGFWVFYMINGFTGNLVYLILKIIKSFKDIETKNDGMFFISLYPAIYCFGLLIFTTMNFR